MSRASFACALLLSLAACEFGPAKPVDEPLAKRYRECDDLEVMAKLASAPVVEQAGDPDQAVALLRECIERCPDLVPAHVAYQDLALRLGDEREQAMVAFYAELADRDSPVPAYMRARLAETAYDQANALESILGEHPDFAYGHLSRARVHRGQGRLAEALACYEQAMANDPRLQITTLERAQVLAELARYEEAVKEYEHYLANVPQDLSASRELVVLLLYRIGDIAQARARIRALRAAGDDSIALRMDSAAALWRDNRPQAAIEEYLGVVRADPAIAGADASRAALNIGLLYYEVVVKNDDDRQRFWPRARVAFRWFLANSTAADGHEQFERTFGVPYRLRRIEELFGPDKDEQIDLERLRWPG